MKRTAGFSLIELMLALALGVVVTSGIVQLFVGNNQTYTLLTGQSRMQESARYALDFIARSARMSGYFGCDPENDKIYNSLNGVWGQLFEFNISVPIEAFDGVNNGTATGDWSPNLGVLPRMTGGATSVNTFINGNGIDLANVRPMTDFLVFRRTSIPGERIDVIIQAGDDPVIEDDGNIDLQVDDFAVISNCEQAALFRVNAINLGAGDATLVRNTGAGLFENSVGGSLSDQGIPYGSATDSQAATVGRAITEIFYIAQAAGTNNRGQVSWSLWRKVSQNAPVELIAGIEDLQVQFGIDTSGDAMANQYVTAGGIGGNPIRSIRISITANSVDVVTDQGQILRRTFTQTIAMRN